MHKSIILTFRLPQTLCLLLDNFVSSNKSHWDFIFYFHSSILFYYFFLYILFLSLFKKKRMTYILLHAQFCREHVVLQIPRNESYSCFLREQDKIIL